MDGPPRITAIQIDGHDVLGHIEIDLHGKRHLIVTGPNGSGKTSLLEAIRAVFDIFAAGRGVPIHNDRPLRSSSQIAKIQWTDSEVPDLAASGFVQAHLRATRPPLQAPQGPSVSNQRGWAQTWHPGRPFHPDFLQHVVNRYTSMYLLKGDDDPTWKDIDAELTRLQAALSTMFLADVKLRYDKSTFAIDLVVDGVVRPWDAMAAGHQAVLAVVAELYARVHGTPGRAPDAGGVVLFDEPELHLHPEMQEVVLPTLTTLFPDLQFIVATHAPPCISSIPDAWVFDLRDRTGIASEELMGRPYGSLLRSHFGVPTDYDEATTKLVDEVLERGARELSFAEKKSVLADIEPLLVTDDPRLKDLWIRLTLELQQAS